MRSAPFDAIGPGLRRGPSGSSQLDPLKPRVGLTKSPCVTLTGLWYGPVFSALHIVY